MFGIAHGHWERGAGPGSACRRRSWIAWRSPRGVTRSGRKPPAARQRALVVKWLRLTYSCDMSSSLTAAPRQVVAEIVAAHGDDRGWLDAFAEAFEQHRHGGQLLRVLGVWGLSQTDAATVFGVTRQAISKWIAAGAPTDRAVAIGELATATDILVRHITRDRIPAVVRRPAANLGDRTLIEVWTTDGAGAVLDACRAMFAFENASG